MLTCEQETYSMLAPRDTPLGLRLEQKRKEAGLSLEQLALHTSTSKSYLWELENGKILHPSAVKLSIIADVLNCSIDYLLNGKQEHKITMQHQAILKMFSKLSPNNQTKFLSLLKMWSKNDK